MTPVAALLLVLPLAMAACPCPPEAAGPKVCGSDFVTYDSQCALDCAGKTGVTTFYPGPCRNVVPFLPNILNSTNASPNPRSSLRSAIDDLTKFTNCIAKKCSQKTCSCATNDSNCKIKCVNDCECDCAGYSVGGNSTVDAINQCIKDNKCDEKKTSCIKGCSTQECVADCAMDWIKCQCKCNGSAALHSTIGLTVALIAMWILRSAK